MSTFFQTAALVIKEADMKDCFGQDIRCYFEGKICYTAREAGGVINGARRRHVTNSYRNGKNIPKRKYFCEKCGYYHVTHYSYYPYSYTEKNMKYYRLERY